MKKMKLQVGLLSILTFVFCASVHAASFEFDDISGALIGDTVRVPIYVNSQNESAVIAEANLNFSRELIWAKSFTLAPGWVPVPGESYNFIDNGLGILNETAGYEGGFSGRMLLGTIDFIATDKGLAEIKISSNSFILNKENSNTFKGSKDAEIKVNGLSSNKPVLPSLFDIRLELENNVLAYTNQLIARAIFQTFGSVPTPVDMVFSITDINDRVLASYNESMVVETEGVFTKKFTDLNLPAGNYILHMNTRYNTDVLDNFELPFSIRQPTYQSWLVGAGLLIVLYIAIIVFLSQHKKSLDDNAG